MNEEENIRTEETETEDSANTYYNEEVNEETSSQEEETQNYSNDESNYTENYDNSSTNDEKSEQKGGEFVWFFIVCIVILGMLVYDRL